MVLEKSAYHSDPQGSHKFTGRPASRFGTGTLEGAPAPGYSSGGSTPIYENVVPGVPAMNKVQLPKDSGNW